MTLLFFDGGEDFEFDGLRVLKAVSKLLNSRVQKVKKAAMNVLIVICK